MQRSRKLVSLLVLSALLVLLIAPAASAQFTPLIFAIDQDVVDGIVTVTRVTSDGPGWIVIHADAEGEPGPVIGYAAIPDGISANVKVTVDPTQVTPVLHPMLHVDAGVEGTYEFPGEDAPAMVNDAIVMVMINVPTVGSSLATVAAESGLTTLVEAAVAAGLDGELASGGPYTVFAPTDEAFAALPAGALDDLLANPEALADVLLHHVVPGAVASSAITESMMVETVQGESLDVQVSADGITVNGAAVTQADVQAYNGVIHVIDAVLLPPAPEAAPAEEVVVEAAAVVTETVVMTETAAMTETVAVTETAVEAVATPEPTQEPIAEATVEPTEEPVAEVTVEPTEEPVAEATVEPTEEPAAEATAEPTEEAMEEGAATEAPAPEVMPATGTSAANTPIILLVSAAFFVLLAGAAFAMRRRSA